MPCSSRLQAEHVFCPEECEWLDNPAAWEISLDPAASPAKLWVASADPLQVSPVAHLRPLTLPASVKRLMRGRMSLSLAVLTKSHRVPASQLRHHDPVSNGKVTLRHST